MKNSSSPYAILLIVPGLIVSLIILWMILSALSPDLIKLIQVLNQFN